MDSSRSSLPNPHNSPAASWFSRPVGGPPPPSPCPRVPDVTEPNTGLEWFEMAASTGPSGSDRGVPNSPLVLASAIQSSPLCYFAVPSTPMQDTPKFPVSPKEELSGAANISTVSPLVQIVPTFGEKEPLERRKCSFKSGPLPGLEMTTKWRRGVKRPHLEIEK